MDSVGESTASPAFDALDALNFFTKDALDTMLARWEQKKQLVWHGRPARSLKAVRTQSVPALPRGHLHFAAVRSSHV
jgi:hypothetical protein